MEVNIYDADLDRLGVVDEIESLIWTRRYWACGDFAMLLPVTDKHVNLLKMGRLLIPQGYREAGVIEYIHISTDQNGQEQMEIQGRFLSCWLGKRVMISQIISTDSPESIIYKIVSDNVTAPADAARTIAQLTGGTPTGTSAAIEYASEENANVLDEVEVVAGAAEIGFRVVSRPREKTHTFETYTGLDLTAGNTAGNAPCIFSREFDNILSQEYTRSTENVRNMAYVTGEEKDDGSRTVVQVGESLSGLDRNEIYISASDIEQTYEDENETEITLTDAEYAELLKQRGENELAQYIDVDEFESTVNQTASLVYRRDFDLGDLVTCIDKRWGLSKNIRITEVRETFQKDDRSIDVVFGEPIPTLAERMKQIKKEG